MYSGSKDGADIGAPAGRQPVGVRAATAFLLHPHRLPPADRDRLLAACRAGGSTGFGGSARQGPGARREL